jgi:transcriptional regulator GlxA family with amidase domain
MPAKLVPALPALLDVRLLWLPDAMPGSLFTAVDVLRTALTLHRLRRPHDAAPLRWRVIGADGRGLAHPFAAAHAGASRRRRATVSLLVVPSIGVDDAPHLGEIVARSGPALKLVQQHAAAGGWIAACSTGLVLPARLGLLDGHAIAAPWPFQSWLGRAYPRVDFGSTEALYQRGSVFGCVSPSLVGELMLRTLGQLLDPDLAQACAQVLLHQPERQRVAPGLVKRQWLVRTSDSPVVRAQQWLEQHLERPYRLKDVAEAAAASERTLLRHFRLATGLTPLEHLHRLRIERAKLLLETTLHGIDAIAEACGYADTTSMRRLFQRETGQTMSAWRERHALRSRRAHWRVRSAPKG